MRLHRAAQLGADVIRFDDIKGGLDSDRWPVTKDGRSIYWAGLNKGKRSIAVDLRNPRGRELLSALIAAPGEGGGIFTTNMPARGWLSYEELSKKRADLIALNIVGDRHGTANVDYTVNAITGFPMVTGAVGCWLSTTVKVSVVVLSVTLVNALLSVIRTRLAATVLSLSVMMFMGELTGYLIMCVAVPAHWNFLLLI